MIGIRDPQNFTSEHFALQERFLLRLTQYREGYLKGIRSFPLALNTGPKILVDMVFQALKEMEKSTPPITLALRP